MLGTLLSSSKQDRLSPCPQIIYILVRNTGNTDPKQLKVITNMISNNKRNKGQGF